MGSAASTPAPAPISEKFKPLPTGETASQLLQRLHLNDGVDDDGAFNIAKLSDWEAKIAADPAKRLARTVLAKQNIWEALVSREAAQRDLQVFNLTLSDPVGKVCNQQSSGRCWIFATCNVARYAVMKNYKLDELELSQSYLFFYDSLEKANWYLEQMIDLADEPIDSRLVQYLCQMPENDGGQFDMVINLIEKYGLVPKSVYPESFNSSNSGKIDSLLTTKLREYALELRSLHGKAMVSLAEASSSKPHEERKKIAIQVARKRKAEQMVEVYTMLSIALGKPPQPDDEFTWEFMDRDNKYQSIRSTPLSFYKNSCKPFQASDCISLINDPRNTYNKLYTVDCLGNVAGGRPVLYVNTTAEVLMDTTVTLLKANQPVWFGCDVGQFENTALGIMDTNLFDFETPFGISLGMNKAQRLQTGESSMTHAMVITAAQLGNDGKPIRFRVENSWGSTSGDQGFFVMTRAWFEEYVFQVVAARSYIPREFKQVFDKGVETAVVLPAWDPMGSLARTR